MIKKHTFWSAKGYLKQSKKFRLSPETFGF